MSANTSKMICQSKKQFVNNLISTGGNSGVLMMNKRPVWAEIDLDAIAFNVRQIRRLLKKDTILMAVVKAEGYGHGAVPVARTALNNGAGRLGVAIVAEGLALRREGITAPVLILGYTPPEQAEQIVAHDLTQTIFSLDAARALSRAAVQAGRRARVHLKIDTGMGRIGVAPGEAAAFAAAVAELPNLEIEGVFSHFAAADSADKTYSHRQFDLFQQAVAAIEDRGVNIPVKHIANSAAILDLPECHLDMVRAGIILYGLWPSGEVGRVIELKPAMQLKARIAHLKKVPAGTAISYGCTHTTSGEALIATVPMGYADGWSRLLSNKGRVLAGGRYAPVVGRVCMDQFMIDVTGVPGVKAGDEVVLFGRQGDKILPVDEIAALTGTINYEVVTTISNRVPRHYQG